MEHCNHHKYILIFFPYYKSFPHNYVYRFSPALILLLFVVVVSSKEIGTYLELFDSKHTFDCSFFKTNYRSFSITNKRPEHMALLIIVLVEISLFC